jgi:beta-lactam-binding protein with PASTA domain
MDQDPSGDSQTEAGSGVTITVGTGPSSVPVPRLYGNTPEQAESVLRGAGLELGTQSRDYNSDVAEGSIFSQNPSGEENVEPGSAVDVIVSLGPEQVEVPEVYGLSVAAAQTTLSTAGLSSTAIEVEGDEPAGTALSTEPGPGAMLDPGSTVSLFYSAGPPPPPAPATPSDDASTPPETPAQPRPSPNRVQDQGNTQAPAEDRQPVDRPQRNQLPQNNSGSGNGTPPNNAPRNSGSGGGGPPNTNNQGSGSGD